MSSLTAAGLRDEWEMALLSAGTEARRLAERERLQQLVGALDWGKLTELLRANRLLPSLGPRILELAGERAGAELKTALPSALKASRHQDALLQLICLEIMSGLASADIRASTLKGPRLGAAIYGEPGRRQSSDIDLLVTAEDLADAVRVARSLGYAPPEDAVDADGLPLLHFSLVHERGELPPVELHWRIHWYEDSFATDRLLPPMPDSHGEWQPAPGDELAALLLYFARDGFTGLRQAVDLGAWWDRFGTEVPRGALEEIAEAYPELAPALRTAGEVSGRMVGIPKGSSNDHSLVMRERAAVRLGCRPQAYSSREQLFAEIGLIDGLLTPAAGLTAFLRRQVAPSPEVIREHAAKAGSTRVASTPGYATRMLARYALALARLLRIGSRRRHKPRPAHSVGG